MFSACGIAALKLVSETFTTNTTWPAPMTTNSLETLVGKGGSGTAADPGVAVYDRHKRIFKQRRDDGTVEEFDGGWTYGYGIGSPPADYCDALVSTPGDPTYSASQTCYDFADGGIAGQQDPTTGAATTAFGKSFPGGVGGQATPVTYNNVAVTPGNPYSLVIPGGGSITITYYR